MTLLSKELQKNEKTKSRKKRTFPNGNYMLIVNFEHISLIALVFLLLILSR